MPRGMDLSESLFEQAGSFVMLPGMAERPSAIPSSHFLEDSHHLSVSHQVDVLTKVFELASLQSSVDHPLCTDCCVALCEELDLKLRDLEFQRASLQELSKGMEGETFEPLSEAQTQELEALESVEQELLRRVEALEKERAELAQQKAKAIEEKRLLDEEEAQYWQEINEKEFELDRLKSELETVCTEYDIASSELARLMKTNVYNDAFHIWHDGPFGTICGFRLGRLDDQPV